MPNSNIEVTETVNIAIKDKSALSVATEIIKFTESYGPIGRNMWDIVDIDHSRVRLRRTYTKELINE